MGDKLGTVFCWIENVMTKIDIVPLRIKKTS